MDDDVEPVYISGFSCNMFFFFWYLARLNYVVNFCIKFNKWEWFIIFFPVLSYVLIEFSGFIALIGELSIF